MSTYNLTINAAALNLGATSFAELVFRRATVTDTYTIVPEFKSRVVMVGGMASIRLPATTPGSVYECLIYGELRQKLRVFFVMPEADALLHELDLWTAWPNADSQGGGRAKWGMITGTLADQTDLQTALNGKANTAHTHSIGQVDGLQTALDGKSNTNHGHVQTDIAGLPAALEDRLTELSTPDGVGVALNTPKISTFGRLRALIAGQDIDVSTTGADGVTIATVGRTLRYWAEAIGVYGTNAYRLFKPVRQVADGDLRVSPMLGGLRSTDGTTDYGVSFGNPDYADHTGTLGAGSLDLQVRKSAAANLPSGTACVAIGQDNKVTGSRNVVISAINGATIVSGNDNYYMGLSSGTVVSGGDWNTCLGASYAVGYANALVNAGIVGSGASGSYNVIVGTGINVTGNYNAVFGYQAQHTASNGLILSTCPTVYGQSLRPRNMQCVMVRTADSRLNGGNGAQIVELHLGSKYDFAIDSNWHTLTSNGLAAGSTNVYIAGGDFFFTAYVTVLRGYDPLGVFKLEGFVKGIGYVPELIVSKTTLYNPNAAYGDARIIFSGNQLLVQVMASTYPGETNIPINGSAFLQCIEPGPAGGY